MKKKTLLILMAILLLACCKEEQDIDVGYVIEKFKEYSDKIDKVEYSIQRIDTFPQRAMVWNNKGVALVEKDQKDEMFGFSFYGKRNDVPTEYIYDRGIAFEVSKATKNYKTNKGYYGFIGSPGGQMIPQNLFHLDSIFKSVKLIENKNSFLLKYEFEDDTVYNVTEITKSVELTKDNFFPFKVTRSSKALGNRSFSQTILSNVKINEHVRNSIKAYKDEFKGYDIIQPEKRKPHGLLGKRIPGISLPGLLEQSKKINLPLDKLTLIDFWEPWCGPCIASFPKVENLKHRYSSRLEIIGIVSNDSETAIRLISKKGITFLNLMGNKDLMEEFSVDSWPRYFLVDNKGIIQKEFFGTNRKRY